MKTVRTVKLSFTHLEFAQLAGPVTSFLAVDAVHHRAEDCLLRRRFRVHLEREKSHVISHRSSPLVIVAQCRTGKQRQEVVVCTEANWEAS